MEADDGENLEVVSVRVRVVVGSVPGMLRRGLHRPFANRRSDRSTGPPSVLSVTLRGTNAMRVA